MSKTRRTLMQALAAAGAVGAVLPRAAIAQTAAGGATPDDQYKLSADSLPRPGVPAGEVRELSLPASAVYPNYLHKAWLYLPASQYRNAPLALMVFQDGQGFMAPDGNWRVPAVLDNLIHDRGVPPMAAVFVNPGATTQDDGLGSEERSLEYDTVSGAYATFLANEVIPAVARTATLADTPAARGIGGLSSGGICAFNAAWHRPDVFSKVFSAIGSFVDIRGGGAYPELIRTAERKPIRVFLQDGAQDGLPGQFAGLDWPAGNRAMARALAFKGYDYQLVMGRGTHNPKHGGAIFPAAMRWLWRDYLRS